MLAYHNDSTLKDKIVSQMAEHRRLEQLIQGTGWEDGKGCMIGCALHSYDHSKLPEAIGVPESVGHLVDAIFEGLPPGEAEQFSDDFWSAVKTGSNLSQVADKFSLWILKDGGVRDRASDDGKAAIDTVISLLQRRLFGDEPTGSDWESAARSAARSAAWSAAWSAARSAAESAARSARSAAESARSAARSAEWSAAWSAEWKSYAEQILTIVKEAA